MMCVDKLSMIYGGSVELHKMYKCNVDKNKLEWWNYWIKMRWHVVMRMLWHAWMRVCWHAIKYTVCTYTLWFQLVSYIITYIYIIAGPHYSNSKHHKITLYVVKFLYAKNVGPDILLCGILIRWYIITV